MNSLKSTIIDNIILVEKYAWTGYTFTSNKYKETDYSKLDFEKTINKRSRSENDISDFEEHVNNAIMRCVAKPKLTTRILQTIFKIFFSFIIYFYALNKPLKMFQPYHMRYVAYK